MQDRISTMYSIIRDEKVGTLNNEVIVYFVPFNHLALQGERVIASPENFAEITQTVFL